MNLSNPEDKCSVMLVKNYIDKHYVLYKIHGDRVSEKCFPLAHDFSIKEKESEYTVDLWRVEDTLTKIFGVEKPIITRAFKELIIERINKMLSNQSQIEL